MELKQYGLKKILMLSIILSLFWFSNIEAAWVGPLEVVELGWGGQNGQVAIKHGDTEDDFPNMFRIDQNGNIIIADGGNGRLQLFSPAGALIKIIEPVKYRYVMVYNPFIIDGNILLKAKDDYMMYDYSGNLVRTFKGVIYTPNIYIYNSTIIVYHSKDSKYYQYSPTGELLQTYTERPLELGKVKKKRTAVGYEYTVQYPDLADPKVVKTYTITTTEKIREFKRDLNGNLYAIVTSASKYSNDIVYRYDTDGNFIGKMQIPDSQYNITLITDVPHPIGREIELIVEYGKAVVAPNGDVYTWKRTPDKYYIIKWTWQD